MSEKVVLTAPEIRRALARIAHEIIERNAGARNVVLVGLPTRGVPIARRLAASLLEFEGVQAPVGALDFTLYRDDLALRGVSPVVQRTEIPTDITGKVIVLVDDVLFTGRSTRAALDALTAFGRPESVQLAVLVDRGHRQLPIRADYVGKNIPTALREDVQVHMAEVDGVDEVLISEFAVAGSLLEQEARHA